MCVAGPVATLPQFSLESGDHQSADSQAECGRNDLGLVAGRRAPGQEWSPRGTQTCDAVTGCTRCGDFAAALC